MCTKRGKPAHLLTNGYKNLQIWSDMIFYTRNLMLASIFTILEYLTPFWAPQGSKGAQNGGKPAHLLTNPYKNLLIWSDMILNMRNLILASIFTILEYLSHFGAPHGVKRDTKWGKPAHLFTNGYKNLPIWLDMIFNIGNWMLASIFTILEYLTHFGTPQRSKGAQSEVHLPISSQMVCLYGITGTAIRLIT